LLKDKLQQTTNKPTTSFPLINSMTTSLLEQLKASADASNGNLQISVDDLQTLFASANPKGSTKKPKKSRRQKDPAAPKRALSAYMLYLRDQRETIISTLVAEGVDLVGRNKVTAVAKRAGLLWGGLADDEKAPYETEADGLKEEYKEAMASYHPQEVVPDEDELPAAPDGFKGPYVDHYLWKNADRHAFYTLADASARAQEIGPQDCGGVTRQYTKDGSSRYFCRKPGPPIPCAPEKKMVSWTLGYSAPQAADPVLTPRVHESPEPTPAPTKAKTPAKPKAAPKMKSASKVNTPAKTKAAAKKKLQVETTQELADEPAKTPEAENTENEASAAIDEVDEVDEVEIELDGSDDDDEDDDGVAVEEVEHEGTTYLAAPTGEVYDYEAWTDREEMVVVGSYDASSGDVSLN